ncbi:MAG: anthrone oxygenase family protein [Geodermatophilaceae bacterium]
MTGPEVGPLAATLAALVNAVVAGALLVALVVILPLLMAEPDERYPSTNGFVLRRMDKVMPVVVGVALLASLAAAAVAAAAGATGTAALHLLAAAGLLTLFAISVAVLRPLNGAIDARPDTDALRMLRGRWRRWHVTRVGAAQVGAVANAVALITIVQ